MKFKYPKLLALALTFAAAYFFISDNTFVPVQNAIVSYGYVSTFISGIFFAYGFTAPPAVAMLLLLGKTQNIYLAALVGGFGALLGDILIFRLVRLSFSDELIYLSNEKLVTAFSNGVPKRIKDYIMPVIAGFIIASPLPDEIGTMLMASSMKISEKVFMVISFTLNTTGIFVILWIAGMV